MSDLPREKSSQPTEEARTSTGENAGGQRWQKWAAIATVGILAINVVAAITYVFVSTWQFGLTRESNEHAYRAWLTARGYTDKPPIVAPGGIPEIYVTIENTGRSPAQKIQARAAVTLQLPGWIVPERFPEPTDNKSLTVVGPGQPQPIHFKKQNALTPQEADGINKGMYVLYFAAQVTYADQFRENRDLRFCYFYDPKSQSLSICNQHNSVR